MVLSYKYDFELSSKRVLFLWLYQVIPNIDLIKYIYNIKEELELTDTHIYHGLCPKHITTCGKWIPINPQCYTITTIGYMMNVNAILIKIILKPGFICSFNLLKEEYNDIELNEIYYGNWVSVVPNINFKPSLKDKINCIETILESEMDISDNIYIRLNRLCDLYSNNDIIRIGFDQKGDYYTPPYGSVNVV
jgi:hypothetical protein